MQQTYFSKILLSGKDVLHNQVVVVEDGMVKSVLSSDAPPPDAELSCHYLVPSFIDLQIYGARERLFSMYPSGETLQAMYAHCKESGTSHFLVTLATNTDNVMFKAIDAVLDYWSRGGEGLVGLHLEGPWINPARRGAHIESYIKKPMVENARALLEHGRGVIKMITLAPEVCTDDVIDLIQSFDVVISAGHSNATFSEASSSFSKGIKTVTHMFNAMSPFHHRDTGLPGAAFGHSTVMSSIIADGYHVDYAAVKIAKRLMNDRLFLITDAVTETKEGPYQHMYTNGRYFSSGTLSGSALTMLDAVKNCVRHCDIPVEEAFRMAFLYPAKLVGLRKEIEVGSKAAFILLDENLSLLKAVI